MKFGILGPGTLGMAVAQWAAECGLEVRLFGRDLAHAQRGTAEIHRRWDRLVAKGNLDTHAVAAARPRLQAADLEDSLETLDALLECLPESAELKARAWTSLAPRLPAAILALTGSSALPVGPLAQAAGLEGRLLGFHLFLPLRRMKALELVVPAGTSPDLSIRAESLAQALGKHVARVKDGPGYAAARMALALGAEAMRLLEEGVADAESLDLLMREGYGHAQGPLEVSDRVGLDLRLAILRQLQGATGDERFRPPEILEKLVAEGALGRRAGRGFRSWPAEFKPGKGTANDANSRE